jgi:hypothetical protein
LGFGFRMGWAGGLGAKKDSAQVSSYSFTISLKIDLS